MMNSVTDRRVHKDEPTGAAAVNLGDLPAWKLTDLYESPDSPAIAADFAALDKRIGAFETHRGKVASLSSAAFGAYLALFAWGWERVRRAAGDHWIPASAAWFTACEGLNPQLFPYLQGSVWYQHPHVFLGSALFGVPFLSFQILLWNLLIFGLLARELFRRGLLKSLVPEAPSPRSLRLGAGWALGLLLLTTLWSYDRLERIEDAEADAPVVRIALLQTNQTVFSQREMLRRSKTATLDDNVDLSWQAWKDQGKVDVFVWPEGAIRRSATDASNWRLRKFVEDTGAEVWTGGSSASRENDGRPVFFNSAFRVFGRGEVDRKYDKMVLLPFGEFMPFEKTFPFLRKIQGVGNYHRGKEMVIFASEKVRFAFLICYEAIRTSHVRGLVLQGLDLLVNITYDAWFGDTTCPHQHLMLSAIQSAQFGVPMVRAATTGISAFVDARGMIVAQTEVFQRTVLVADVKKVQVPSPFAVLGDLFLWTQVVISGLLLWKARNRASGSPV